MKTIHTRTRGDQAELRVAQHLECEGFTVIARNYHCRNGEIDIIARRDEVIAFVEVKMRVSAMPDFGELVNVTKQKKIITAARRYIAQSTHEDVTYRFDVACVIGDHDSARLIYIPDAFNSDE